MVEPRIILEERLERITAVAESLRQRINKLPAKSPDRRPLSAKLHWALTIAHLLKAELGTGPQPTHKRTDTIGGVTITTPVWEAANA